MAIKDGDFHSYVKLPEGIVDWSNSIVVLTHLSAFVPFLG